MASKCSISIEFRLLILDKYCVLIAEAAGQTTQKTFRLVKDAMGRVKSQKRGDLVLALFSNSKQPALSALVKAKRSDLDAMSAEEVPLSRVWMSSLSSLKRESQMGMNM